MPTAFVLGSLNVHRADCDRKHAHPCDPWAERAPRFKAIFDKMRASVYTLQECLPEQAADLGEILGWGSRRNPPFWWDENQNVILADPKKWFDVKVVQCSLWRKSSELANRNRRSVNCVLLQSVETGDRVWACASHLESGDAEARVLQAGALACNLSNVYPLALGIDRNSYTTEAGGPRKTLDASGLAEVPFANPNSERSFHGWEPAIDDGKCIDGIHYRGLTVRDGSALVSTVGLNATDHSGIVARLAIP